MAIVMKILSIVLKENIVIFINLFLHYKVLIMLNAMIMPLYMIKLVSYLGRKIKKKKIYLKKSKCPYSYKNDRNKIVFGSVLTLHTFGRDLKWNPHIHCLVCEEAFDTKKNKMKNFSFISYKKLRKTWMYQVLDLLSKQKLKHFHYLKQRFYDELVNGFYVYAKKKEKDNDDNNVDDCVNYITRYTSRPPMAENRIIKYEDDKKMIRW